MTSEYHDTPVPIPPGITYRTFTPGVITGGLPDPHTTWHHAACNHCGWDTDSRNNPAWRDDMTAHRCGAQATDPAPRDHGPLTICRMVHYQSYGTPGGEYQPQCRAAVITAVGPSGRDTPATINPVSLAVFNPDGIFLKADIPHDETHRGGGTWHWSC